MSASPHLSIFLQENSWQICFGMEKGDDEAELCHVLFPSNEKQKAGEVSSIALPMTRIKQRGVGVGVKGRVRWFGII